MVAGWLKKAGGGRMKRRKRRREVEAVSYLVKNRLRAAHLVPFANTTSGLMHSARWKRVVVRVPSLSWSSLPEYIRREAIDLSNGL